VKRRTERCWRGRRTRCGGAGLGRRPARARVRPVLAAVVAALRADGCNRARRRSTLVRPLQSRTGRRSATASASATTRSSCSCAGRSSARADDEPQTAARARGLPVRQHAGGRAPPGRSAGRARRWRGRSRAGRLRPGHVHQLRGREIQDQLQGALARGGGRRGQGSGAARESRASRGARRPSRTRRPRPSSSSTRSSCAELLQINLKYGLG
jgi:hypothetical protein